MRIDINDVFILLSYRNFTPKRMSRGGTKRSKSVDNCLKFDIRTTGEMQT